MIILTDADGLQTQRLDPDTLVVLMVSYREVTECRVGSSVERLMALSDDSATVATAAGHLFIVVEGFDDDPRPLVAIPEVRRFFQALHDAWPFSGAFLSLMNDELHRFVSMLVPFHHEATDGDAIQVSVDAGQWNSVLGVLGEAVTTLHRSHGVPANVTAACLARIGSLRLP